MFRYARPLLGIFCLATAATAALAQQTTIQRPAGQRPSRAPIASGLTPRPVGPQRLRPASGVATINSAPAIWRDRDISFGKHRVLAVRFSPDGRLLAAGGVDKRVRLVETGTWKELRQFGGHLSSIDALDFSPDGKQIAASSQDGIVLVWNVATGEETAELPIASPSLAVRFMPDSRHIITGDNGGQVRIWDLTTEKETARFTTKGYVRAVSVSADGLRIAAGGDDREVHVWEAKTGRELATFKPPVKENISSVELSADGKRLLWSGWEDIAGVWDVDRQASFFQAAGSEYLQATFAQHETVWCFTNHMRVEAINASDRTVRYTLPGQGQQMTLAVNSPDGRWFAAAQGGSIPGAESAGAIPAVVSVWDAGSPQRSSLAGALRAMAAGHDERVFAAATSAGAVALWENNPFKLRQTFSAKGEQRAVAISPGERHVAAGGDDGIARFWQIGGPSAAVEANCGGPIRALVFLENKHAAVAAGAGLTLIDLATAKVSPLPLTGQAGEITAMGASPDGKRLVVGTHEGAASILDAATGNELAKLARPEPGSIGSAQFSPDGRYVLLADWHYGGLLFDAATAKLVMQYSVPSATGAAWSPDGKYCSIFNGRSGAALLFTPDSAVPQQQIDSGFWQPTIAILPDSKSVAVATAGGELLLYPFKPLETGFPAELTGGRVELYTVAPGGFGLSQLSGPTGRGAAAAEPGMGLWDLEKHELVVRMQELAAPVMSADHQMIAGSSVGELTLLRDGKEVLKTVIMPRVRISALAFSPDATRIAAAFPGATSGKELVKPFVRLYSTSNLQEVRAWPIEQELVTAMQFSPDGRTLITRSGRNGHIMGADGKELAPDFRICFWNVQDGSRLQVLPLGTLAIGEHFTPDSTRLLVVTGEGVIISYVVDGLKETGRIRVPGNGNAVASALSVDGKWMLITADEGDARLISVDPLKFAGTVALPGPANYERPLFLKDGRPAVWTAGRGRSGGMALHIGGQPR